MSIWLGNVFFVGLIISGLAWWNASEIYSVGMDVVLERYIPLVVISILFVATILAWINWKVTKGRF